MEEGNVRLETELTKAKIENSDLKTRLMEEFNNATAENLELKTRIKQNMQGNNCIGGFVRLPSWLIFFISLRFWEKLAKS